MEERSLRVIEPNTTFFSKVSNAISKLLIPGKVGLNGMLISIKRNNAIKYYESFRKSDEAGDVAKRESTQGRYEESYTLYLESIDKYIMDSVYKKVKNGSATVFERDALSNYYNIVHLKDSEYLEYKYRKQKFLLELDYESFKNVGKDKLLDKYKAMYVDKMDVLYKGIIKNYSIKLADGMKINRSSTVILFKNIFETLEEYVANIVPIKLESDKKSENYELILAGYEEYEKFAIGKLDEKEYLEKNMILLGLSRVLFTHSLPLAAAEQCYNKLLRDLRSLLVNTKNDQKREEAYKMLMKLIEDYNVKLLSTKVYWDNPDEREEYKKFWDSYSKAKNTDEKEVLALKRELSQVKAGTEKNNELRKLYKVKLKEYGALKQFKNSAITGRANRYKKVA